MEEYIYNRLLVDVKPTQLPISLATAKAHLRVDHSDDDTYITALIWSASQSIEDYTKFALSDTTYSQYVNSFDVKYIELMIGNVKTISSITYWDENESQQSLHSSNWYNDVSYNPARIYFKSTFTAPKLSQGGKKIMISFRAGNDISDPDGALPYTIQQALLLLIGHWYENRMAVINTMNRELPMGVDYLLDGIKIYTA